MTMNSSTLSNFDRPSDGSDLGDKVLTNISQMLESSSFYPFLAVSEMPLQEYWSLIAGARAELYDTRYHLYITVYALRHSSDASPL